MRRGSLLAVAAALTLSCGPRATSPALLDDGWGPSPEHAGRAASDGGRASERTAFIAPAKRKRWKHAPELEKLSISGGRGPSEHGQANHERTVLLNSLAGGYLALHERATMPPGAMIVQQHHREGSDDVAFYFVMLKRPPKSGKSASPWDFIVLDELRRVAAQGDLALCRRCHLEAPFQGLFGPPQAAPGKR